MNKELITTRFNERINTYIVVMPEYILLDQLQTWRKEFIRLLAKWENGEKAALLLDTNRHQFESIECLKFLRQFLSKNPAILSRISRAAFVAPKGVRDPEIVNSTEAYFCDYDEAYQWLRRKLQ